MTEQQLQNARILWDYHNQSEPLAKANLIVGLGSYDMRVADRCAELLSQNFAPQICFSGAAGNWTSGLYERTEAESFAKRAAELGIDEAKILIEKEATNIVENVNYVRAMFPSAKRIIWVTKPQTQRRVRATLDRISADIDSIVTCPKHGFSAQPTQDHNQHELICEMVGDTWRIAAYPEKGYMVEQPMPDETIASYNALVAAGFSDHLPKGIVKLEDR